jgi:hypothetical protein
LPHSNVTSLQFLAQATQFVDALLAEHGQDSLDAVRELGALVPMISQQGHFQIGVPPFPPFIPRSIYPLSTVYFPYFLYASSGPEWLTEDKSIPMQMNPFTPIPLFLGTKFLSGHAVHDEAYSAVVPAVTKALQDLAHVNKLARTIYQLLGFNPGTSPME